MQQDIEDAHGNVLTLGLGLGYFAYMVHRKEMVSSVTIIEKDKEIIELFQNYLLPQFDHPEKIRILEGDAFDLLSGIKDGEYDYLYGDLWEGPWDGTSMVERLKEQTAHFRKTECRYWIEAMMYSLV
jgi:spermidine synthase